MTLGWIQRCSVTMPDPVLVNGIPQQPWEPETVDLTNWGKLQIIVGGRDLTRLRGVRFVPLRTAGTEPFGDAEAAFAFPGLTDHDDPGEHGLHKFDPVRMRRKDPDGDFHVLYEGDVASWEPDAGLGLVVQCVGVLYRADLLKEPPELVQSTADRGHILARMFNRKRRQHALNIGAMSYVHTGIRGVRGTSDFSPLVTGAAQDQLAEMTTDDGDQWTIKVQRPRTPKLVLKDVTTEDAAVTYGTPGVEVSLSRDFTAAVTAVFASGSNGHCQWTGARFPNLTQQDVPAYPLPVGQVFTAGDSHTGFAEFAAFLRRGQYGTIVSDDRYDPADVDNVEQFQDRAGIIVDGVVGAQTWEAAFQPGANQGSSRGGYIDTVWEKNATLKRKTNAQGADTGRNPNFDPDVPRIEDYIPFGDHTSKNLGRRSAKQTVNRGYPAGRVGTIVLNVDPEGISRFQLHAGMNIRVRHFGGGSILLHIIRHEVDWQALTVTLTVDEKARDLLTAAAIHQRDHDVSDVTRRQRFGRRRAKIFNDYGTWLCEDGAGEIPLMNQQGGFWNVQRIAAAPKGTIERISLALGAGLTEHLLNQNLADGANTPIPGATRGAIAIFAKPITARTLTNLLGNPLAVDAAGDNPWDREESALTRRGKIYAAGGPGQAIGYFPRNDPDDPAGALPSGRFEDGGGVEFGPTGRWWLWVAIYTEASCKAGGQIFPGPPS